MIVECPETGAQKSVSSGIKRNEKGKPIAFCMACGEKHVMHIAWTNEEIEE